MNKIFIILIIVFICLNSCKPKPKSNFEAVMQKADKNRPELEKVITHYSQNPADSLKLKAAYFLIINMNGRYYFKSKLLDKYYNIFKALRQATDSTSKVNNMYHLFGSSVIKIKDSLASKYGNFKIRKSNITTDLESLNAQFLINNIDMAFKVWTEQPWCKDVNFKQFCEYILPYKIADEKPDYDRKEIYEKFNPLLDSVRSVNGDAIMACKVINNVLIKQGWTYSDAASFLPSYGAKTIINERIGVCNEMTEIAVFVMRAVGIPVSIDCVTQWPNWSGGHNWNVVLGKDGHTVKFTGVESNPGDKEGITKKAKVFRNTFLRNNSALVLTHIKSEFIPQLFKNPNLYDVSDEYFNGSNITIPLKIKTKNRYAYIAVFNNRDWIPVHIGKISKTNSVTFAKMGNGIIYLTGVYNNESWESINYPFILDTVGKINYLEPNFEKLQTLSLRRKFPVLWVAYRLDRMVGGKFQGANKIDFSDAITLYEIKNVPEPYYSIVNVNSEISFRYLRYLGPPKSQGNIAELEFYSNNGGSPLKGKPIGTIGSWSNLPDKVKEKALDGNTETFFDAPLIKADSSWVGIDLGYNKTAKINAIRYMPANDGNNIIIGNDYELMYYNKNEWVSVERIIATSDVLNFKNVPSNALYILHNYTKGVEERIFTYENGKQIWW